jgi:glycosyltransferase involved in cell wall biosynthesis
VRVLFVTTCLEVGGAERMVVNLADGMAERGHDVAIVFLRGAPLLAPRSRSVQLIGLGFSSAINVLGALLRLRSALRRFKPDVVHSHLFHANILARLARLTTRIPCLVTTAHNRNEVGALRWLAYRLTARLSNVFTNVSEEAVRAYVAHGAVKPGVMLTVHNGISTRDFRRNREAATRVRASLGIDPDTSLIVAVGRLVREKDYPNLLHALSGIRDANHRHMVLIVGDGPLMEDLRAMVQRLSLCERVRLLGLRRDVVELLSAADVFVLSSAEEGFPMVVGEAMACECMVVATDCGGVREFIGETGLIAPAHDSAALGQRLREALALSVEERGRYGRAARTRIERLYSLDATIDKWLSIYRRASAGEGA